MDAASSADALAELLSIAYDSSSRVMLPAALDPMDAAGAYEVQQRMLKKCALATGGWKIGAKSPSGPIQGAPLPLARIYGSRASLARSDYPVLGLELELYFTFDRDFLPQARPLPEREVLAAIGAFGASIEIVSSRISGWPQVPKLSQLADLQNNGALVTGGMIDYRSGFSYDEPSLDLSIGGLPLFSGAGRNPAGDPRRLLCWLVNHCRESGLPLPKGSIITTGSYTGLEFPATAGTVTGEIEGLPAVTFELL